MQESFLSEKQCLDLTKQIVSTLESKLRIVPLNTLKNPYYRLKSIIYITLKNDGDIVIAAFNDIDAFSYGDTESEAIDELCKEIVMLYEDLTAETESLGPLPRKWLLYLKEIIECR